MATISRGGRVEAKSQREYLPGNSYPEERYTPRCVSRSFRRRCSPFLKGTLETTRVTAIPIRVEYLSSRITTPVWVITRITAMGEAFHFEPVVVTIEVPCLLSDLPSTACWRPRWQPLRLPPLRTQRS